jgi:large exoprotein involved in heme utilization and adhesion
MIRGGGGLPERPGELETSLYSTGEIQSIPGDRSSANANTAQSWQAGDPIVEPEGIYPLTNGQLVLSRECTQ